VPFFSFIPYSLWCLSQPKEAHNMHNVLPVPVGDYKRAFFFLFRDFITDVI
jgi:hypothetical protein